MNTFIEKLAEALYDTSAKGVAIPQHSPPQFGDLLPDGQEHYRNLVRAVLAAARVPSEEMVSAMVKKLAPDWVSTSSEEPEDVVEALECASFSRHLWQAAIDEALKP